MASLNTIRISPEGAERIMAAGQRRQERALSTARAYLTPVRPEAVRASVPTRQVEAIVAVFDLSGFTAFCNQADPAANIPTFLDGFLEWLFGRIEEATAAYDGPRREPLWKEPPFFAKFLGDGLLLLWDTADMAERQSARLLSTLLEICGKYREFHTRVSQRIANPPASLRCRVARGTVFSVNNGRDYVGHCINLAARLQDYKTLSFCVASAGFNAGESLEPALATQMRSITLAIRGVKAGQSVWVLRRELEALQSK